jgi:hypothetical protein
MSEVNATLVCWACGKKHSVVMTREPQFAFELALGATDVGWVGCLDLDHDRTLVFCSNRCRDSQVTKRGLFRARPKVIEQET